MPNQVRVTFQPSGRSVRVVRGTTVVEAVAQAGLTLDAPCGGAGVCGKCGIQITSGAPDPGHGDLKVFDRHHLDTGWRLACQTALQRDAVISIPKTSLFDTQAQILTQPNTHATEVEPSVRKMYVELDPPSLDDGMGDLERLRQAVGPVDVRPELLRKLPAEMRSGCYKGTAVIVDGVMIAFEPGDTVDKCYGVAFDIGTTTLAGSLLDLRTGAELALDSAINPQVQLGDDVLARIQYASKGPEALNRLGKLVADALRDLTNRLCEQAGVDVRHVYEMTFAGNTTMQHLLVGVDVSGLGQSPFVPAWKDALTCWAGELGSLEPRGAMAYFAPMIGGFVGGDTSSAVLATGLGDMDGPVLMIDIGTNGEIVLSHAGKMWASSTAAGPAFEGARISCGMRGVNGAIEKVKIDQDVKLGVIGDVEPAGLCGSGLIDLVAELLRLGVITPEGRLLPPEELPESLPAPIRSRASIDDAQKPLFILAESSGDGRKVTLSSGDVRELQLASAAIRAGVQMLLQGAGLGPGDPRAVLIAGGFGGFINRDNARRIGLLPAEVRPDRISYVGNASLQGARSALLSSRARRKMQSLAAGTAHVELSRSADFQLAFADAMLFPSDE